MNSYILPPGQDWLIDRMQCLGYKSDSDGVCSGFAHMVKQAILSEDLKTFELRLKLINEIPLEQFRDIIESLKQKKISIFRHIKENVSRSYTLDKELKIFEQNAQVQAKLFALKQTLTELIREGKLKTEESGREFERRKKALLFNAYVQQAVDQAIQSLPQEEQLLLDIPAFLDGIEYYHNLHIHRELAEAGKWYQTYPNRLINPRVLSKKLEAEGGMKKIKDLSNILQNDFSGMYCEAELIEYFNGLRRAISQSHLSKPICLVLDSGNHTIIVGYDPIKKWQFANLTHLQLPIEGGFTLEQVANKVLNSFSGNGVCTFSTEVYTTKPNEIAGENCITNWKNQDGWKKIHTATYSKAKMTDSFDASWLIVAANKGQQNIVKALLDAQANPNRQFMDIHPLYTAAKQGHFGTVMQLLAAGADPNCLNNQNTTPLLIASEIGHFGIVKELLATGANPNLSNCIGITPLFAATQGGYADIVEELLIKGANPNQADNEGVTALYKAAEAGRVDIVKKLLSAGANPNQTSSGAAPLSIAVHNGHIEVVRELLANQVTNRTIAFNTTLSYIQELAKKGHREDYIETIIKKNYTLHPYSNFFSSYTITPEDIAHLTGNQMIANLFKDTSLNNNSYNVPTTRLFM